MIAGLPYVVHPASCRSCRPGRAPSWARTAGVHGTVGCPCCPGTGREAEGLHLGRNKSVAVGGFLCPGDEAAAADKAAEQFPTLRESGAGGDGGVCVG